MFDKKNGEMAFLKYLFLTYPILGTMYILVACVFWFWMLNRLSQNIDMSGLNYKSGRFRAMTAEQQRIEYNKFKLKAWFWGIIVSLVASIFWPISLMFKI